MLKIMIGIPFGKSMDFEPVKSLLQLASAKTEGVKYHFTMVSNSLVYEAREELARQFMESDCEYLFFLDNDMTFDPRTPALLARHKRDLVTAKAFKRVPPYSPCFYTTLDIKDGKQHMEVPINYGQGLLPIQGCGMACCLIHRSVFERIEKPWFFPMPQFGEDLAFCYRAGQAGVKMFCDTTIQCGHVGTNQVTEQTFHTHLEVEKAKGKSLQEVMGV